MYPHIQRPSIVGTLLARVLLSTPTNLWLHL